MPRWKDDEDRGDFGAWLSGQVGDRTFDWLAAAMAERGHRHGADYYRAMASGNKPPGRIIGRALREFFGAPANDTRPSVPAGDLASAITALVDELRALREERVGVESRLRALEAQVDALTAPDDAGSREPRVPRTSAVSGR
jgi:hypothetical protein